MNSSATQVRSLQPQGFGVRFKRRVFRSTPRRIIRAITSLRFHLLQRRRHEEPSLEHVAGTPLLVLPGVMNPVLFSSGKFLAESLRPEDFETGHSVLDLGTGSGVAALRAALWSSRVTAVDINPLAVRCARINVLMNRMEDRIEVLESDLFENTGEKRFDRIIFNPPYLRGRASNPFEQALYSEGLAERLATDLEGRLEPGGALYLVNSSLSPEAFFLRELRKKGFASESIAFAALLTEDLWLHRIERPNGD